MLEKHESDDIKILHEKPDRHNEEEIYVEEQLDLIYFKRLLSEISVYFKILKLILISVSNRYKGFT